MTDQYRAVLYQEPTNFQRNTVRLIVYRKDFLGEWAEALMSDGTWQKVPPRDPVVEPDASAFGVVIPAEAVEALAVGVERFQGHVSHADTEARVLREWLGVERERVDRLITREPLS